MNDLGSDRCKTSCGEDPSGCFIVNSKHVECFSDIVINKVWSAREIIEMGAIRNRNHDLAELLDMAIDEMDKLIVWVQQIRAMRIKSETSGEIACRQ